MDPDFYALATEYEPLGTPSPGPHVLSDGSYDYFDDGLADGSLEDSQLAFAPSGGYGASHGQQNENLRLRQQLSNETRLHRSYSSHDHGQHRTPSFQGQEEVLDDLDCSPTPGTRRSYLQSGSTSKGHHSVPGRNESGFASLAHSGMQSTNTVAPKAARSLPPRATASSIELPANRIHASSQLIPVSKLPEPYAEFFRFGNFNSVQSATLPTIYETNHNVLVNAPTGAGKTVLFELAILRMLEYNPASKAVYMAPTKSLCGERCRDWTDKFYPLGIKCIELTGDSELTGLADAKLASIIVTTPEKWDSMTRRWFEFTKLLNTLRLVCIDEVHTLNEERGSVLEVIVARMKTLGTNIRFLAVSATVPNIQDVAEWLGDGGVADQQGEGIPGRAPAKTFIFGEEHRPVKLSKFVYGYPRRKEQTEFQFMSLLNFKIMDLIINHSSGKPTLIFCGTRKSSFQAAEILLKAYQKMVDQGNTLPWSSPPQPPKFSDKKLTALGAYGIGVHNAGLDQEDRRQMEDLFLSSEISVLCTTSTLAVGVNLPARLIIIRGTKTFRGAAAGNNGFENYSDLDLIQMMGRAGRPQFDNEGVAVVMTAQNEKVRIEKLVNSQTMLESCLHLNLTEHINSEVTMGTITSATSAIDWINNSFLSVRIKKNPKHYSIGDLHVAPEEQLANFVSRELEILAEDDLIAEDEEKNIHATELGEIMSKFCLRHKTFLKLLRIPPNASMRDLLEVISEADEYSTMRLRADERPAYKALNSHAELKYPIHVKVMKTPQKLMLLIQASLGGIALNEVKVENTNPVMEVNMIWQHLPRICKCLVALSVARQDITVKSCLELLRSVNAKAWENSVWVLRQIDLIGEKSVKRLAENGITTIEKLKATAAHRIEMILDRNPPFGTRIIRQAQSWPSLYATMNRVWEKVVPEGVHVCVEIAVGLEDSSQPTTWRWKNTILMATVLVMTSDQQWIEFRTIQVKLLKETKRFTIECVLIKPSQSITTTVACTQIAGIGCNTKWKPSTPREDFPKPKAITDSEAAVADLLEGLDAGDFDRSDSDTYIQPAQTKIKSIAQSSGTTHKTSSNRNLQKAQTSQEIDPVIKAVPQTGEKLENGRYKCAHKCKGCNHPCCIYGVLKPPKKQSVKDGPAAFTSDASQFMQKGTSASKALTKSEKPKNLLPVAPFRTTTITRTSKVMESLPHMSNQESLAFKQRNSQCETKEATGRSVQGAESNSDSDQLPSLTEPMTEGVRQKDNSARTESPDVQDRNSDQLLLGPEFNPDHIDERHHVSLNIWSSEKRNSNEAVPPRQSGGLEKFRNRRSSVENFDEKEIFDRTGSSRSVVEKAGQKNVESGDQAPQQFQQSSSPEIEIITNITENQPKKPESKFDSVQGLDSDQEESMVDEAEERYDSMVFKSYLVEESRQEKERGSENVKRPIDELGVGESDVKSKEPKLNEKTDCETSMIELPKNDENSSLVQNSKTEAPRISEGLLDQPHSSRDRLVLKSPFRSSNEAPCEDTDSDDDPILLLSKQVLAWAEAHVVDD